MTVADFSKILSDLFKLNFFHLSFGFPNCLSFQTLSNQPVSCCILQTPASPRVSSTRWFLQPSRSLNVLFCSSEFPATSVHPTNSYLCHKTLLTAPVQSLLQFPMGNCLFLIQCLRKKKSHFFLVNHNASFFVTRKTGCLVVSANVLEA
jgi:hypothetical protein